MSTIPNAGTGITREEFLAMPEYQFHRAPDWLAPTEALLGTMIR